MKAKYHATIAIWIACIVLSAYSHDDIGLLISCAGTFLAVKIAMGNKS